MRGFGTLLVAVLLFGASHVEASGELYQQPANLEAFTDSLVPSLMRNHNSPSGAVVIVSEGRVVLAKGYGYQDIERQIPVDPYRTLFRPGSVAKLLTWIAVMQQVERGRLDLDEDVNLYLTDFKIRDTFEQPVTLRHIMTHTPGFEDGGMGYLIIDDPSRALPLKQAMAVYQPERVNPPGVQTAYSNYGAALAGLIVANVSGMSFSDYIQQNIFDPLGMKRSTFLEPLPQHLAEGMAQTYAAEGGRYVAKPFEVIISFSPAGGMSSTATDMAILGMAILNGGEYSGGRVLQADSVDLMLRRHFSHDDRLMGMALGFYETERNGVRLLGHDGDTAWFHSELVLDQTHELAYFISFGGAGGGAVRSTFKNAFYNHFFPADEEAPQPAADFASRADRFAGSYWFWRSNFSTIEKAFGMSDSIEVTPTANNTLAFSIGGATKQYVEVEENLFRELDSNLTFGGGMSPRLIAFQENAAGDVTGFILDEWPFMSLRKKPAYETMRVQKAMMIVCLVTFLGMVLRALLQHSTASQRSANERRATRVALATIAAHGGVLLAAIWVMQGLVGQLRAEIPLSFKLVLVLPIVATVASLILLYQCVLVWQQSQFSGVVPRVYYSLTAACAAYLVWFYYYWNILGFQLPG